MYSMYKPGGHYVKWKPVTEGKKKPAWFYLYDVSKIIQLIEAQNSCQGLRSGEEGTLFNRYEVLVIQDE